MSEFEIHPSGANSWWRETEPAGALLNKLMLLFIFGPIALVMYRYYVLSFVVFALIVPYGLFTRHLAVRAVKRHLIANPDFLQEFREQGIVLDHDDGSYS